MKMKLTVLVFFTSMLLAGQVLALPFSTGGLSYNSMGATDVEVTGRASGNIATDIVIPDTVVDSGTTYNVTNIGSLAFFLNSLTSVIIPSSVTTIEVGAFGFNALTSVIIPDSVTTIESGAFGFNTLTSAAFEGDFGSFNLSIFDDNPTLATITYCNGTAGWPQVFNNGSTIVVTTPRKCLSNIDGLSYSVINATDVEVTGRASGNTATDIVIPDTVVVSGTTYSVTTIGDVAFHENALTSVIIPGSVTTIGQNAFSVNALSSVVIPDSVKTIGGGAFDSNALTSVIIPDSVATIGAVAFESNALASLTIGNNVTTIDDYAFGSNALTSVIIPASVTTIGPGAFYNNALTSAAFEGDFLSFSLTMFGLNFNLATITYCDVKTGWPQGFNNGSTIVVTTPIVCLPPGC
ncbi:leucine-rich repeat domain-containing protein [Candidatus Marimicrobium litorale]|uniref:Leucine-rich repeat domain-containing protein n=1 Tax=Candidatus Marimicrobium litorale TaxID=2518991 RepID=A0ABT3T797_9GAMM|nr:leucine-rich repeat domain-containing protein [Candidatus Marimicrobium litorale]MCX2977369.1 leucine-rich repeat domain-containing protein [Candidatus Marimicrobium litorale]